MDRVKQMQIFARVAERKSFTKAADDLLLPRATVTNQVKQLEKRLKVQLFNRTTRQVDLTNEGEIFYERCLKLLAEIDEAEHLFSNTIPKGMLVINVQGTFTRHFVMPYLKTFINRYPDIHIQIFEDDRYADLVKEGIDCVLRAGPLPDSTLIARKVAEMKQVTLASPEYLQMYGRPEKPEDLKKHFAVGYGLDTSHRPSTLSFRTTAGEIDVSMSSLVTVNSAQMYTAAALGSLGIIQVPRYHLESEIKKGNLIELLNNFELSPMPISILYPKTKHLTSRARVFIDWLTDHLSTIC
ncbi:LysR family transcriptional regulator [Oceanospirillum sediminis]|uniref:LysR family transcriptional regulator n=1 Tax=Oceanospirillum sediminis TaxID=2760088 RepID=A0A839IVJ0_9GAMM|nr:LysR family transcriptional regulator [Oceanospirillum sediminis]MBB1488968.1 LysR family transcriptional regulator [Oceanospirillum sediminis]